MLELPESHTVASQLQTCIQGKTVQTVVANSTPHGFAFYFGDPSLYHERACGKRVDRIDALGGQVELYLEDMRLLLNDGVNIRYLEAGAPRPKKHQLLIEFDDATFIFCTVQMYGGMSLFANGENDGNFYYTVAREKPSPLTDAFDASYFGDLLSKSKPTLSAKAFLATEQRIPGLGNGVLQDILFRARVHPKRKLSSLSGAETEHLFQCTKQVLGDMTRLGGRDTEKDLFGKKGGYPSIFSKNTWQYPCPVCGGGIARQTYLGGNVYFCPACQPH